MNTFPISVIVYQKLVVRYGERAKKIQLFFTALRMRQQKLSNKSLSNSVFVNNRQSQAFY